MNFTCILVFQISQGSAATLITLRIVKFRLLGVLFSVIGIKLGRSYGQIYLGSFLWTTVWAGRLRNDLPYFVFVSSKKYKKAVLSQTRPHRATPRK